MYIWVHISSGSNDPVVTNSVFQNFTEHNYCCDKYFLPDFWHTLSFSQCCCWDFYDILLKVSPSHSWPSSLMPWFQPSCTSETPGELLHNPDAHPPILRDSDSIVMRCDPSISSFKKLPGGSNEHPGVEALFNLCGEEADGLSAPWSPPWQSPLPIECYSPIPSSALAVAHSSARQCLELRPSVLPRTMLLFVPLTLVEGWGGRVP